MIDIKKDTYQAYCEYMQHPNNTRRIIPDLLRVGKEDERVFAEMKILAESHKTDEPFRVLLMGSVTSENVSAVYFFIKDNFSQLLPSLRISMIDIQEATLARHKGEIPSEIAPSVDFSQMNANLVGFSDQSVSLVIQDMMVNFNERHEQNQANIEEMRRVLRRGGLAFYSTILDLEEREDDDLYKPTKIVVDNSIGDTRFAWTKAYYKQLFQGGGFQFQEFAKEDSQAWTKLVKSRTGENIPYTRYLLKKQ